MQHQLLYLGRSLIERGAWFFAPISWAWGAFVFCKNMAYERKWLKSARVPCTVVSVGNIVAGGTGKTPFVLMLAKRFSHRKVAILTRGYGRVPDEALLFKKRLPNSSIYIGKNRTASARRAVEEGAELILLDDGFQHRKLHRDFDLVLLNADDPYGKGHYLPWGYLRDSPKRKADAFFLNGKDFCRAPVRILDEQERSVPSLSGWKIGLFCGIGSPSSFKKTVCRLGAIPVAEWFLADHEPADPARLERFAGECKALGAKVLVTTEKDFIKGPKCSLPILFIEIEIEWLEGGDKWEKLIAEIDQKIDNRPTYDRPDKN